LVAVMGLLGLVAVGIYVLLLEVVGVRDARQVLAIFRQRAAGSRPA
jgi:hypothetical protein